MVDWQLPCGLLIVDEARREITQACHPCVSSIEGSRRGLHEEDPLNVVIFLLVAAPMMVTDEIGVMI